MSQPFQVKAGFLKIMDKFKNDPKLWKNYFFILFSNGELHHYMNETLKMKIGDFKLDKKVEIKLTRNVEELNGDSLLIIKQDDRGIGLVSTYQTLYEWNRAFELVKDGKIKIKSDLSLLPEKKGELIELDFENMLESPKDEPKEDKKEPVKKEDPKNKNHPPPQKKKGGFFSWIFGGSSFSSDPSLEPDNTDKAQNEEKDVEEMKKKKQEEENKKNVDKEENKNIEQNKDAPVSQENNNPIQENNAIIENNNNQHIEQNDNNQNTGNVDNNNEEDDDHSFLLSISEKSWDNITHREMQMKTLLRWSNLYLRKIRKRATSLMDFSDGLLLMHLTEVVSKSRIEGCNHNPHSAIEKIQNISKVISFLQQKLPRFNISASLIVNKNLKTICTFLWSLFNIYELDLVEYNGAKGIAALIGWLNDKTKGYEGVDIHDFSKSWSDGRAFCALIDKHKPNLITYELILPYKKIENIELAFDKAESEWDIERLLDSSDFIHPPDEISVLIYLTSWKNTISNHL